MSRPRQRVRLESGLSLDLNKILHRPRTRLRSDSSGSPFLSASYRWTNNYTGEQVARALLTANVGGAREGWFRIRMEESDQKIILVPSPRHFGGHQWYFVCPMMNRRCSVIWMPPGASRFGSRQAWNNQVAYASQFETPVDRAHRGKAKINAKLIGDCNPDEWDLPPKPKWMRWRTYNDLVEKFDCYEELLDRECAVAAMRLLAAGWG